jgi:hypothetical protein
VRADGSKSNIDAAVDVAAEPVVFWFNVGTSAATILAPVITLPLASTVTLVYVPAVTPEFAKVATPVTFAEPLNAPDVYVTSPVKAIVRAVVNVAALPVVF